MLQVERYLRFEKGTIEWLLIYDLMRQQGRDEYLDELPETGSDDVRVTGKMPTDVYYSLRFIFLLLIQ